MTQQDLANRVGVVQSTISKAEGGRGASLSLDVWQRIFLALDRPFVVEAGRDPRGAPTDAGHLAMQELVLRLGRANGIRGSFELPVPNAPGRHSVDVLLRDDRSRRLLVVECVNSIGDIGAAARAFGWKLTKASDHAAILAPPVFAVHGCWVLRATGRNRELARRYPEVFKSRFAGSSVGWVRALTGVTRPPAQSGLVWSDVTASRIFEWRPR